MSDIDDKLEQHTTKRRVAPGQNYMSLDAGVTVEWLSQAFGLHKRTVVSRLRTLKPLRVERRGTKMLRVYYDIKEAAAYLVTPRLGTKEYMAALKRNDLPPALQQQVWDALLKRQKWEENAGDLWRTEKIREVLGSTFQTIKFTMQLWTETLERQVEVSPKQREIIIGMVDALQGEIYAALAQNATDTKTQPQIGELPELVGEEESILDIEAEDAEIESLV